MTSMPSSNPEISVIMPVFNGGAFLDRSLRSVCRQSFPNWELIAVDDGSTDDSCLQLDRWAGLEPRIQAIRRDRNEGPAVARNHALRRARGETIVYLDCDDEYYPDYLSHVHAWEPVGEVLVFTYDIVEASRALPGQVAVRTWDPAAARNRMMDDCIVIPMGIAHRRSLLALVGLFKEGEGFFFEEDLDLWRRMARAGAEFLFLPLKSGRYYVRPDSLARTRERRKSGRDDDTAFIGPVSGSVSGPRASS